MIKKTAYIFISILIFTLSVHAQQESKEDLTRLDFKELKSNINKHYKDSGKVTRYAEAFFLKAKKLKDTNNLAIGYYYRKNSGGKYKNRVDLYDSIISLESGITSKTIIPTVYHDKGNYYQDHFHYDKALTNYLKALSYLKNGESERLIFSSNLQIANIKLRIGQNQEALEILKKSYRKAQKNNYRKKYSSNYNATLLALSNAYRKSHYNDSALAYIKIGIQENIDTNKNYYFRFLLVERLIELEKTYNPSVFTKTKKIITYLDSINTTTQVNENINISLAYYHIGNAHIKNENYDKAITNLLKMDTAIGNSPDILPETIKGFHYLKEYYKKEGNPEKGLEYANKIIQFDSIFNTHYKNIDQDIKREFDIPFATEEARHTTDKLRIVIIILISIGIIASIILILQLIQKNKYKKRFKQLVEETIPHTTQKQSNIGSEKPNIPEEIFIKVKKCLEVFEKEKQFLDKTINSTKLAKNIGTNGPYFSKAFKYLKNESFNVYLRDTRLDYAIERLQDDSMFRKYTIKSIAHESGFNNPESFSKYFYKKYKIYPSFFIKQLEKEE